MYPAVTDSFSMQYVLFSILQVFKVLDVTKSGYLELVELMEVATRARNLTCTQTIFLYFLLPHMPLGAKPNRRRL